MTGSHPPIISLKDFDQRKAEITEQLMSVGKQTGFFYIADWDNSGHGPFTQDLVDRCFEVHRRCSCPQSRELLQCGNRSVIEG